MTKLCDFKRDNPSVLTWLTIYTNSKETRTQQIVQQIFLQQSITNCTFNVTLSVHNVHQ